MDATDASVLHALADRQAVIDLLLRYCRGIDRRDWDLVRACFYDDAHDVHVSYEGGPDDFIVHVSTNLPNRWESTMHFIGNQLIDLDGDVAFCESYCVAYHRAVAGAQEPYDMVLGLRYVDRVERRGGDWRIAHRVCAVEWSRIDPITSTWELAPTTVRGRPFPDDVVYQARM